MLESRAGWEKGGLTVILSMGTCIFLLFRRLGGLLVWTWASRGRDLRDKTFHRDDFEHTKSNDWPKALMSEYLLIVT